MSGLEDRVERLEAELGIEPEPEPEYRDIDKKWVALTDENSSLIAYAPLSEVDITKLNDEDNQPLSVTFETSVVEDTSYNQTRLYLKKIEVVDANDVPDDWTLRQ